MYEIMDFAKKSAVWALVALGIIVTVRGVNRIYLDTVVRWLEVRSRAGMLLLGEFGWFLFLLGFMGCVSFVLIASVLCFAGGGGFAEYQLPTGAGLGIPGGAGVAEGRLPDHLPVGRQPQPGGCGGIQAAMERQAGSRRLCTSQAEGRDAAGGAGSV